MIFGSESLNVDYFFVYLQSKPHLPMLTMMSSEDDGADGWSITY